jgi:hypothetical protein
MLKYRSARGGAAEAVFMSYPVTIPEDVDLAQLCEIIEARVSLDARSGFELGKTAIRDTIAEHLGCSALMAEQLVDTLVLQGMLSYAGDPGAVVTEAPWLVR